MDTTLTKKYTRKPTSKKVSVLSKNGYHSDNDVDRWFDDLFESQSYLKMDTTLTRSKMLDLGRKGFKFVSVLSKNGYHSDATKRASS